MALISDNTKIGMFMTGLGVFFLLLGILFFFDAGLLAIGNVLFLVGIPLMIGWRRALDFFNPMKRAGSTRGVVCFVVGLLLVLYRWALVGIIVELIGMVELFGRFLPLVVTALRTLPIVGPILKAPLVDKIVDFLSGAVRERRPPV